jgi:hypothetical protein
VSTARHDYDNARDFVRKAYLFVLRLSASSWTRRNLRNSLRRRFLPSLRSDEDRITKRRIHPFDEQYGTDTSGETVFHELRSGLKADAYATVYLGSEPSVLRSVIAKIPDRE